MRRRAWGAAGVICLLAAAGTNAAERLSGEQIRRVFESNTVTGLYRQQPAVQRVSSP